MEYSTTKVATHHDSATSVLYYRLMCSLYSLIWMQKLQVCFKYFHIYSEICFKKYICFEIWKLYKTLCKNILKKDIV